MEDIPLYVGKRKNILVLSGGGIKGLATLGSLKCLMDNEIIVKHLNVPSKYLENATEQIAPI